MDRHPHHPGGISSRPSPATRATKARRVRTRARRALLDGLRAERRALDLAGAHHFDRHQCPLLFGLAQAARDATGRSVEFQGVRFGLRFGIWRYVVDPGTGKYLVAAGGGWL